MAEEKNVLFAIDLGNKQTKMKSSKAELIFPSAFAKVNPNATALFEIEYPIDELGEYAIGGKVYHWGTALQTKHSENELIHTMSFNDRYSNSEFQHLLKLALARLSYDFTDRRNGASQYLCVDLVLGLPTSDFNKDTVLMLKEFLKREVKVTVEDTSITIIVDKVDFIKQFGGTILDLALNNDGEFHKQELLNETIGIVDIGGGTILVDECVKMSLGNSSVSETINNGIYNLYRNIAQTEKARIDNLSEKTVQKVLHTPTQEGRYLVQRTRYEKIDLTNEVEKEIQAYTENLVSKLKNAFADEKKYDFLLFTGGGANIVDLRLIKETFGKRTQIAQTPELANVRGFYKYALANGFGN